MIETQLIGNRKFKQSGYDDAKVDKAFDHVIGIGHKRKIPKAGWMISGAAIVIIAIGF